MDMGDVYQALQARPLTLWKTQSSSANRSFQEVAKYLVEMSIYWPPPCGFARDTFFQSLTADQQKISQRQQTRQDCTIMNYRKHSRDRCKAEMLDAGAFITTLTDEQKAKWIEQDSHSMISRRNPWLE